MTCTGTRTGQILAEVGDHAEQERRLVGAKIIHEEQRALSDRPPSLLP